MSLIHCNFNSQVLDKSTSMYVILPEVKLSERKVEDLKYQTLYLLHGIGDDHTKWARRTNIERYVKEYNVAVIMPEVDKSFYADMEYGNNYWTFISEEVPNIARTYFPLSDKREDNFVAGLSMGGYGSFKLALNKPESFEAAASFSGALDIVGLLSQEDNDVIKNNRKIVEAVFGGHNKINNSINDLFYLAKNLKESGRYIPRLYQCCGTEDSLYECNISFRNFAKDIGIDLTYEDGTGNHDWEYWDKSIQKALEWFNLNRKY